MADWVTRFGIAMLLAADGKMAGGWGTEDGEVLMCLAVLFGCTAGWALAGRCRQ